MNESVNIFLIGAQKSGTTTLSHQLAQHPDIDFCNLKEPDFFSKPENWSKGFDYYHSLYEPVGAKIRGEGSTTYSWLLEYPETAKRIYEYNPDAKIIYLMRQPVDRIVSHYTHHLLKAKTKLPKEQEVFEFPTYINHSRYAIQARPYLEFFPRENILFLLLEEYAKEPLQTLYQVAEHIGLDPQPFNDIDLEPQYRSIDRTGDTRIKKLLTPMAQLLFPVKVRNALRGPFVYKMEEKVQFSDELKQRLWRYVEDDVLAMERIMERSLDIWRNAPYNQRS